MIWEKEIEKIHNKTLEKHHVIFFTIIIKFNNDNIFYNLVIYS